MIDEGTTHWIFDTYAWALERLGTDVFYEFTELVLPNDRYFPDKLQDMDDVAVGLFNQVRRYAGMEEWQCRLVELEEDANPVVGPALVIEGAPSGPSATFSMSGGETPALEIAYNPSQPRRPEALIATFALGLAHYLIRSIDVPPPGGDKYEEHAAELVAVFIGFGVFLANEAFSFSQFTDVDSQGWWTSALGCLSEGEVTYCLAIFLHLKGIDSATVQPFLDKNLRNVLESARKHIACLSDDIERLRNIRSSKMVPTCGLE